MQTGFFLGDVDQTGQRQAKACAGCRNGHRALWECVCLIKGFHPRKAFDHRLVTVPCTLGSGVHFGYQHRHFQTRRDVHLRARGTDAVDQRDDPVQLAVRIRVQQIGGGVCGPIGVDQHLGAGRRCFPQLFCDERHDRMQQDQALIQHPTHRLARLCGLWRVVLQQGFRELHIPVADLAPDKRIKRVGGVVKAVVGQRRIDVLADAGGFTHDPFVQGRLGGGHRGRCAGEHVVHFGKPVGVPQFRAEVPVACDAGCGQLQVAAHGGHRRQRKAHGVRAVFVDQFQRVEDIAERFRHLLALLVAHQSVDIDGRERLLPCDGELHHHHAGDPEKDDVKAGDQDGSGEVFLQRVGVLGPAERADGPEAGREPRV